MHGLFHGRRYSRHADEDFSGFSRVGSPFFTKILSSHPAFLRLFYVNFTNLISVDAPKAAHRRLMMAFILAGVLSGLVGVYLVYTMIHPEKF